MTLFRVICDCGREYALAVDDPDDEVEDLVPAISGGDLMEPSEPCEQILPSKPDVEPDHTERIVEPIGFSRPRERKR